MAKTFKLNAKENNSKTGTPKQNTLKDET